MQSVDVVVPTKVDGDDREIILLRKMSCSGDIRGIKLIDNEMDATRLFLCYEIWLGQGSCVSSWAIKSSMATSITFLGLS